MYLASHGTRNLCVASVVGALALGGTGVALASSPGTGAASPPQKLATAKHRADVRLDRAQVRLDRMRTRVDRTKALTVDRALLDGELTTLGAQLKTVHTAVDAASTGKALHQALHGGRSLAAQGRIVVRQARQLGVAGATGAAATKAAARLAATDTRVNALPAGSPGRAAFHDLQARVADAATQAALVATADRGLDVTNIAAATRTLKANEAALTAIRADHKAIKADRKQVAAALRSGR